MVFLDGSFVTDKPEPGDFDLCWVIDGVDEQKVDPIVRNTRQFRQQQKDKYGGEFYPAWTRTIDDKGSFFNFFQTDKFTGQKKGIVSINIQADPFLQLEEPQ